MRTPRHKELAPVPIRHVDRGVLLAQFAQECLAVCPNCSGPVMVSSGPRYGFPFEPKNSKAVCLKCSFQRVEGAWAGPVTGRARRPCPNCGFKWLTAKVERRLLSNRSRDWAWATCTSCQQPSKLPLTWSIRRVGEGRDPCFGLPLWLTASCCGEVLWAYNGTHLQKLREYVSADLRESTGLHWSMFARLPKWMSARKNRDAVLTCIDKLERRLPR
jgi:hypothetical protein